MHSRTHSRKPAAFRPPASKPVSRFRAPTHPFVIQAPSDGNVDLAERLRNAELFGHNLAHISAVPPGSTQPIQRVPRWKKLLTGTGVALGAGALAGGALLSSPLLALGGGALGAYSAYSYLTHDKNVLRSGANRLKETHQDLEQRSKREGLTEREGVLKDVLGETTPYLDDPNVKLTPTSGVSDAAFLNKEDDRAKRKYEIEVNPDNPVPGGGSDPHKVQASILHELTHISADQKYAANDVVSSDDLRFPYNEHSSENGDELLEANENQVKELQTTLAGDEEIPREEKAFIHRRLDYILGKIPLGKTVGTVDPLNPFKEYDTVINELLYYSHAKGFPETSPTSQALTRVARERYQYRNTRPS